MKIETNIRHFDNLGEFLEVCCTEIAFSKAIENWYKKLKERVRNFFNEDLPESVHDFIGKVDYFDYVKSEYEEIKEILENANGFYDLTFIDDENGGYFVVIEISENEILSKIQKKYKGYIPVKGGHIVFSLNEFLKYDDFEKVKEKVDYDSGWSMNDFENEIEIPVEDIKEKEIDDLKYLYETAKQYNFKNVKVILDY